MDKVSNLWRTADEKPRDDVPFVIDKRGNVIPRKGDEWQKIHRPWAYPKDLCRTQA